MSIAFCTIVLVVLIALVASFSAFYSNQVEKAVNENISQVAVIKAKTISSQFERMEIFLMRSVPAPAAYTKFCAHTTARSLRALPPLKARKRSWRNMRMWPFSPSLTNTTPPSL